MGRIERETDYKINAFGVETNAFQLMLANEYQRQAAERNIILPVLGINNQENKQTRIRCLTPYLSRKMVRIRSSRGGRILVNQLKEFPHGAHDDGPDCFYNCIFLANKLLDGKRKG